MNVLAKIHVSHPVLHLSCLTLFWFHLTLPPNYSPEVYYFYCFDGMTVSSPSVLLKNRPWLQLKILIFWNYFILLSYPFTFIACASIYDFISSILYLLNPLHFNFCFWSKSPYLPLFIMSQTILQFCQDLYIVCCLLGFSFSKRGPSSSFFFGFSFAYITLSNTLAPVWITFVHCIMSQLSMNLSVFLLFVFPSVVFIYLYTSHWVFLDWYCFLMFALKIQILS